MKFSRHWTKEKIIDAALSDYAALEIRFERAERELAAEEGSFRAYRDQTTELIQDLRTKLETTTGAGSLRSHECQVLRRLLVQLYNEKA